jgi:hypothetical protein
MGPGAGAATEFLQRHCRAGEAVAANIRAAAQRCAALREDLWRLVDAKTATAVAVDDRRVAERPTWLAAAQTVLTGAGDRSSADDIVDQQIKPYVEDDIRTEWLDAMRSTAASVDASFDAATNAVSASPAPRFDVPGDFAAQSPLPDTPPTRNDPVPVLPAGAGALPADSPPVSERPGAQAAPPAQPVDVPAPVPADDPLGTALGDLGGLGGGSGAGGLGGLGGLGGGIGGIISQIVDAVGGILGSLGDGPDDPFLTGDKSDADDSDGLVEPETPEDAPDSSPQTQDPTSAPADPAEPPADPAQPPAEPTQPPEEPAQPPEDPAQPPEDPAQPPTAPAPADPVTEPRSPCEIAADELPQAGQ